MTHTSPMARHLTDEIAAAAEPRPSLEDIIEWVARLSDAQYADVQAETVRLGRVPQGMARELYLGRKAIDLMGKIIERKDEVLFLLKAPPRDQRGRR